MNLLPYWAQALHGWWVGCSDIYGSILTCDNLIVKDDYNGVQPRWHILFNFVMLRLVSFNMDYYWQVKKPRDQYEVCIALFWYAYAWRMNLKLMNKAKEGWSIGWPYQWQGSYYHAMFRLWLQLYQFHCIRSISTTLSLRSYYHIQWLHLPGKCLKSTREDDVTHMWWYRSGIHLPRSLVASSLPMLSD